jgi:hypothetical protein
MSLPASFRVKISSENAEMSVTPVVVREMPADELVRHILGVTGKNPRRIREILQRGTLVAGSSRMRWDGADVTESSVTEFLQRYPDADPSRAFHAELCLEVVLRAGEGVRRQELPVSREEGTKRRWFHRQNFWEALFEAIGPPDYREYSYKESADVYRRKLTPEERRSVEGSLRLLTFPARLQGIDVIDLYVPRASSSLSPPPASL